jgi:hypothetical protein
MDASAVFLEQWTQQVKQLWSTMHQYRQESLALAILGIVLAGQAVRQRVAEILQERLSNPCQVSSYERRLQRLIANEQLALGPCWEQFLPHTLPFWQGRRASLVLDWTPYNDHFTIVCVGILVQTRLLPLAWEVMPQNEEWDEGQWQLVARLFAQVAQFLSAQEVILLADRGLSALPLIRLCERQHWHYVLRIKKEEYGRRRFRGGSGDWQCGKQFLLKKGTSW